MQRSKKKRILTWTLAGLGLAILALGTVLVLTMPPPGSFAGQAPGYGRFMERGFGPWAAPGPGQAPGASQGSGDDKSTNAAPASPGNPGYGPGYGRGFDPRGMRGFGHGPGPGFGPMGGPGPRGMGGHGPGMFIIGLILLVLIIGFARRAMHRHGPWAAHGHDEDALTWLRREYAEGKISEEEYKKRLSVLKE